MGDALVLLHTAITIIAVVLLITVVQITPVVALMSGAIYLGLATGLGFMGTTQTIARGFGDLMAEVGLLITFGVLLGAFLAATGTLQRVMEALIRIFGPEKIPYAFSLSTATLFPAIYSDVLLVLTAPLSRSIAPRVGRNGIAMMGGALTAGIEVGLVFVVPGAGTLAVAGLLGVPLGTMLVYGLLVAVPTALLATFVYGRLLRYGLWNKDKDELEVEEESEQDQEATEPGARRFLPLFVLLLPILVTLLLIASGAVAAAVGLEAGVLAFLGDPIIALFLGLIIAYFLAWYALSSEQVGRAIGDGFRGSGQILILTGISGSLAAVIGETGLENILAGYFSAGAFAPLLLVWLVAALLHVALGSVSVAAITAAGILAPIAGSIDVPVVLIALAAGSGALFVPHVSSNFFWLFQTLLGLSTQGTFKSHSVAMTLASVISLPLILGLSLLP